MASYPTSVSTLATNKTNATVSTSDHPAHHNAMADEINAIETELGTTPSGPFATVAARLADIEADITTLSNLLAGGAAAYTVTNGTTDRTYDANSYTMDEIADVLATLIADLKVRGVLN